MVTIHKKNTESAEETEKRLQREKELAMGLQDNYQARGFELVTWVQDNKGKVSLLIVAVLAGCAAFSGYLFYKKRVATEASANYMQTMQELEEAPSAEGEQDKDKKSKEALVSLKDLTTKFPNSNVALLASISAAHLALEHNDAKEAVNLYENSLRKIKQSDALYPLVMVGLGYAYKKDGSN